MTIMTTTFIPCGAKAAVHRYDRRCIVRWCLRGWHTAAYFLGVAAIIISGIMLKKTKMFAGDPAPFVMELACIPLCRPLATCFVPCGSAVGPSLRKPVRLLPAFHHPRMVLVTYSRLCRRQPSVCYAEDETGEQLYLGKLCGNAICMDFRSSWIGATGRQPLHPSRVLLQRKTVVGTLGILYGGRRRQCTC